MKYSDWMIPTPGARQEDDGRWTAMLDDKTLGTYENMADALNTANAEYVKVSCAKTQWMVREIARLQRIVTNARAVLAGELFVIDDTGEMVDVTNITQGV
jgi:hypothetical protein